MAIHAKLPTFFQRDCANNDKKQQLDQTNLCENESSKKEATICKSSPKLDS